jgi:hypothetical protein
MTRFTWLPVCTLIVMAAAASAWAQDSLSRRVTLDLKAVEPSSAFGTIASSAGLNVKVDPAVTAPVDILLRNVKASTALDAICDSIGCQWRVASGTLSISPATETALLAVGVPAGQTVEATAKRRRVERVHAALAQKLPGGMIFQNAPLAEVGERLSTALGLRITITCDSPKVQTLTADLSHHTLQSGLKLLMDQAGSEGVWTIAVKAAQEGQEPEVAFGLKAVPRKVKK